MVSYCEPKLHVSHCVPPPQDISPGFVLCDPSSPCHVGNKFEAQIAVLEHKSIICAGYSAVLHIHSVVEEVHLIVSAMCV